jgi:hypothetical protein
MVICQNVSKAYIWQKGTVPQWHNGRKLLHNPEIECLNPATCTGERNWQKTLTVPKFLPQVEISLGKSIINN